jgi:hypothetical protein
MAESPTLTIRIDEDLKAKLEKAAGAADQTVTEYVARSVRQRMAGACPTCGHDGGTLVVQPPGLTKAFEDWVLGLGPGRFISIGTVGPGGATAYYGGAAPSSLRDSFVEIGVDAGAYALTRMIPRSEIQVWAADKDARPLYQNLVASGYADGNQRALQQHLAATEQRPRYRSPGRANNRRI